MPYWIERFAARGYEPLDLFRRELWDDSEVHWWLSQNMVLFIHRDLEQGSERLREARAASRRPLGVVHPGLYLNKMQEIEAVRQLLMPGGLFRVTPIQEGAAVKIDKAFDQAEELVKLYDFIRSGGVFRVTASGDGLSLSKLE